MNTDDPRQAELDARLRKLLGGLDASAGFEERVMHGVAKLAAAPGARREDLRAQFERRRELVRRRLRREAWMNGITIVGLGTCAGGLLWRYAPEIQRFATQPVSAIDPIWLIVSTFAVLGAAVWLLLKQAQSGR